MGETSVPSTGDRRISSINNHLMAQISSMLIPWRIRWFFDKDRPRAFFPKGFRRKSSGLTPKFFRGYLLLVLGSAYLLRMIFFKCWCFFTSSPWSENAPKWCVLKAMGHSIGEETLSKLGIARLELLQKLCQLTFGDLTLLVDLWWVRWRWKSSCLISAFSC